MAEIEDGIGKGLTGIIIIAMFMVMLPLLTGMGAVGPEDIEITGLTWD